MKTIPLTQGQFAIVDDGDYEELNQYKWFAQWSPHTRSYYAARQIRMSNGKQTQERIHRVILGLERGDKRIGDHLNHVTLDNRRSNIRIATGSMSNRNRRCKGWTQQDGKYRVRIMVDGISKHIGLYDDPPEARAAYLEAKRLYHPTAPKLQNATAMALFDKTLEEPPMRD